MTRFSTLDYAIFGLYLFASLGFGVFFHKQQKDIQSYFLADKSVGFVLIGISILASLFSGISFLAIPSEVYTNGIGFFLTVFSFFIATPIATVVFLPFYYRSRFYTAYQYLEERFFLQVRLLASALFIIRVLLWMSLAMYAPALALNQVTGLPIWIPIVCTGLVTTIYTTMGGMKAVIWADVLQFFILAGGQILILFIAVSHVPDGFTGAFSIAREHGKFNIDFSIDPRVRVTFWSALIGGAFLNLVQMATDQVSVQRYLSAKSLKESQRSLWFKLTLLLPFLTIFYLTGLVLFAFYQVQGDPLAAKHISKPDQILPYFVVNNLPVGMPGLLIAAIYAASMSAISAGINSLTSASVVDFYQRLWASSKKTSDAQQLRLAKTLSVVYGLLVMGLAFIVERLGTLVEASNKVIGLVGGPLLGLFVLGMLSRRANGPGAVIGWVAGIAALIPVCFASKVSFLWYTVIGFFVTVFVGQLASLLFPAPLPDRLKELVLTKSRGETSTPSAKAS